MPTMKRRDQATSKPIGDMARQTGEIQFDDASATSPVVAEKQRRGRGARSNQSGRFEPTQRAAFDDGWETGAELPPIKTSVQIETARRIITTNNSPDIGFEQSINAYRSTTN